MAAIWKGSVAFGLVNIPVELHTAVRADHISFRLLDKEDLSPVKYERVSQSDGEPVAWEDIVKGYEYEKGKYVVMTDEDFKAAAIEGSKSIDILDFVKEDEIDPRYFETPYYLVPGKNAEKAYALLREAIRATGSVGIGKVSIRQSQHLAGIKVVGDALILEIMRFSNEIVDVSEYSFPGKAKLRDAELDMAKQLVENLETTFDPERYTDDYRANLMKIIKARMEGKEPRLKAKKDTADDGVLDLMSRLKASLEKGEKSTAKKATRSKRSTAKKTSRSARKRKSA